MSYIKLSDAKNAITNCIGEQTVSKYATSAECKAARHGADLALFSLDNILTADVVEVVRCKDCKCYEPHGNGSFGLCKNRKGKGIRAEADYCSYGERREKNAVT